MRLVISSERELEAAVAHRKGLLSADEVWLSDLSDGNEFTGGHPDPDNVKRTLTNPPTALWDSLIKILVQREQPLKVLALHSTALQQISRRLSARRQRLEDTEPRLEWVASQAPLITVERLVMSGQISSEYFWHHLKVTQVIELRGCKHAFRSSFFERLVEIRSSPEEIVLVASADMDEDAVKGRMTHFSAVQRWRSYPGDENRAYKKLSLKVPMDSDRCQQLQSLWETIPQEYQVGQFVIESLPRPLPGALSIAEMDHWESIPATYQVHQSIIRPSLPTSMIQKMAAFQSSSHVSIPPSPTPACGHGPRGTSEGYPDKVDKPSHCASDQIEPTPTFGCGPFGTDTGWPVESDKPSHPIGNVDGATPACGCGPYGTDIGRPDDEFQMPHHRARMEDGDGEAQVELRDWWNVDSDSDSDGILSAEEAEEELEYLLGRIMGYISETPEDRLKYPCYFMKDEETWRRARLSGKKAETLLADLIHPLTLLEHQVVARFQRARGEEFEEELYLDLD